MRVLALVLLASLGAGQVFAETPPTAPRPPTEVSPVTVMPKTEPPLVTTTFPAAGQAVAPGVLILRITFDQPMQGRGFDIAPAQGGEAPDCLKVPRLLDDGKSFVLLCSAQAGKSYALAFNAAATGGFVNLAEVRAKAATLAFTTTTGDPVRDLDDALKAASLRPVDGPVQETPGLAEPPPPPNMVTKTEVKRR